MRQRGFTLIEVIIALGIIVMLTSITLPALNNVTRAELRKTSRMTMGLVRSTYDSAALTVRMHRIVFDLSKNTVSVESTEETLAIDMNSNALVSSTSELANLTDKLAFPVGEGVDLSEARGEEESSGGTPLQGLLGMGGLMGEGGRDSFQPTEERFEIPEGVKIMDVWTQHMGQPQSEGKVSLYFFPNGYTQDAMIHFESEGGQAYSVKVSALTGKTKVFAKYEEVKR